MVAMIRGLLRGNLRARRCASEKVTSMACQQGLSTPIGIELHKVPSLPNVEHYNYSRQIRRLHLNLVLNAVQAIGDLLSSRYWDSPHRPFQVCLFGPADPQ
jgi:hypothetical protein